MAQLIKDQKIAEHERSIAALKQEVAILDDQAAVIAGRRAFALSEIAHFKLAIKSLKGTLGDSSSSETSPSEPDDDAAAAADVASRQERASASHYELVANMNTVEELMGHLNSEPELRLNSTFIKAAGANKKIRCLEFLSTNTDQFLFSGDDGCIRKWQLDSDRLASPVLAFDARLRGSFPHHISINPTEESVVVVYGPNEKLAVFSLWGADELVDQGRRKTLIEEIPHQRGISQVAFMPWRNNGNPIFISSGNLDHDIASWGLFDSAWKTTGHYFMHTNLVTGICGLYNEFIVISVGRDKLISALDLEQGKKVKEDKVDSECQGVAANPVNLNLLCVQTSTSKNQLRLWDVRERGEQLTFGWRTRKVSKTTLVAPAWSPSGLLLSAGSADREVKVFDIRYNEKKALLTCEKHDDGQVFKVAWAPNQRVLLSASAKEIGLHRYI